MTELLPMREQIARIIDPSSWRVMDGYLEQTKRKYAGQNVGWPEDQFWDKPSLTKADAILALRAAPASPEGDGWMDIASAPRDGTKIDLLYPHPRGRFIDASWDDVLKQWARRTPLWAEELLPEAEWAYETLPNMAPLAWMPSPPPRAMIAAAPGVVGGGDNSSVSQSGYDAPDGAASAGSERSALADHLEGMSHFLAECTEGTAGIYGEVEQDRLALEAGANALRGLTNAVPNQDLTPLEEELVEALRPFAAIAPSSLYAADGSEAEGYSVMTYEHDRLGHQLKPDFTGADLAIARSALSRAESRLSTPSIPPGEEEGRS